MGGAQRILALYHRYALCLGVTSYRLELGNYHQTWLTRSYALALNIFVLLALPVAFYRSALYIKTVNWFPNLISYTTYVLYSVSYGATAYTLISRGTRDTALMEMERIVSRLKRLKAQESSGRQRICRSLSLVFYMKLFTVFFLCFWSMTSCLMMPADKQTNWAVLLYAFFFSCAMNIPLVATYRYFLALWDIAYCYQYLNVKLERLMKCVRSRYPTKVELQELHRLWSLHALLGRCTLKLNRIFGLLMLSARFDSLAFSVVNAYWGILFVFSMRTPFMLILYGFTNYSMRLLDFFLLNLMCDLTVQHQSHSHHLFIEGYWFKELNAYLLYAKTFKMNLWVCGLYKVNRKSWFQMLGSILNFVILLMQFHLLFVRKHKNKQIK